MDIEKKDLYNISDFTLDNYRRIVELAKERYTFIGYNEIKNKQSQVCLWRHDVDHSVEQALKLATIENQLGVSATYFIQLSSDYYNVFDPRVNKIIREIIDKNHKIGLHFHSAVYSIKNESELISKLSFERDTLEKLLDIDINVFSFHNPTTELAGQPIASVFNEFEYAGMTNTYAEEIKEKYVYCSDSNGYWRHKRLEDFLKERQPRIQVLTHPVWWQDIPMAPRKRIEKQVNDSALLILNSYDKVLEEFGRENIR